MLDKIRLFSSEFKVRKSCNIQVESRRVYEDNEVKASDTPVFTWENGSDEIGTKAYINTEYFNATMKPVFINQGKGLINVGTGLAVSLNPGKVVNGENITNVTKDDLIESLKLLKEFLGENFEVDGDMKLTRFDVGINLEMKSDVSDYLDIMAAFPNINRKMLVRFGSTVLFKNKSRQFIGYNKKAEFMDNNKGNYGNINPHDLGNLLRIESRFMRKRAHDYDVVGDLVENYDAIREGFKKEFLKFVQLKYEREYISYDDLSQNFDNHRGKRYWLREALVDIAILNLLEMKDQETLTKFISDSGASSTTVSDFKRRIKEMNFQGKLTKTNSVDLVAELKKKVDEI